MFQVLLFRQVCAGPTARGRTLSPCVPSSGSNLSREVDSIAIALDQFDEHCLPRKLYARVYSD
jgi:hypothetical protein